MVSARLLSERYRHGYLLTALVLLVMVRPFLGEAGRGLGLIDGFFVLTIVTAVAVCAARVRQLVVVSSVAVVAMVARVLYSADVGGELVNTVFLVATGGFCLCVAAMLLHHIFRRTRSITTDTIFGAMSAYMLVGLTWACGFALLEAAQPGSFDFGSRELDGRTDQVWAFIGFSFTTLTTLGYGNIAPMSPRADALATSEAMVGQFYVAVLIGRLIGMQLTQRASLAGADQ